MAVQYVENLAAAPDGVKDILGVFAAAVHIRLIAVIHFYTELLYGSHKFLFKVLRIGLRVGVGKRIFHIHVGHSDVLFKITVRLRDVDRNLSQPVKLVPRKEQSRLFALCPERADDKVACRYIAEIAYMYGTGRTDTGGAYVFFLVRIALDNALCYFF